MEGQPKFALKFPIWIVAAPPFLTDEQLNERAYGNSRFEKTHEVNPEPYLLIYTKEILAVTKACEKKHCDGTILKIASKSVLAELITSVKDEQGVLLGLSIDQMSENNPIQLIEAESLILALGLDFDLG